ncbi:MAG: hypothetical protein ACLQGT_07465 [Terracidiphilus sp.]
MRWIRAVSLIILSALPLMSAAQTKIYRNRDYGYEVPIPHGLYLFSPHQMSGIDHGRQLFFKPTRIEDCNHGGCDRYIVFWAEYNTIEDTAKLHDFFEWECTIYGGKECLPPPEDLKINSLKSESARVLLPGGRIEFLVVTQAGKSAADFDATVPSINYSVCLLTTQEHLEEDLRFFRIILKTIRIHPRD